MQECHSLTSLIADLESNLKHRHGQDRVNAQSDIDRLKKYLETTKQVMAGMALMGINNDEVQFLFDYNSLIEPITRINVVETMIDVQHLIDSMSDSMKRTAIDTALKFTSDVENKGHSKLSTFSVKICRAHARYRVGSRNPL